MTRKIKAEITSPIQNPDGTVIQPGTRFDEDDKALAGLPPGHVRYVIVEEDEPESKPTRLARAKSEA